MEVTAVSTFDVLDQHGAWRLTGFVVAVAVFLLLQLIRLPFRLIEAGLLAAQRGLDARITQSMTPPTTRPFYAAAAAGI